MRVLLAGLVAVCALAWAGSAGAAVHPIGDGAWSWFGDPRAVTHDGRTYVGWVDQEGDVKVSSYDHATGERVTAVLQARLNQDDHANPSLLVRPDGRLVVFYSRHVGPSMHYRVSSQPGDVSSWEAPQTVPTNTPGIRGYTYPNPIRLEDEAATYLFWRGGNYNPTFSIQKDGETGWSPARTLITMPGERPYAKYDSSGGDTIHVAYTNAHPTEFGDVNIYYARVRAGKIERAGGQQIGSLDDPITPAEGNLVYDGAAQAWVHDVAADSAGNPVIVFASFPSPSDHRYHYARWTGSAWEVHEITAAGGTFREDGGSPDYSGGITLDHEDPSRVYLSRQVGPSSWQVETWTTADGGTTWSSQALSSGGKNVRPVSPRGMSAFGGDMSVIWMNGSYPSYVSYDTEILALMAPATNAPPIADTEPGVRSGAAPLEVTFETSGSRDPDGSIASYEWDFGDGTSGTGPEATHTYTAGGRYFPTLTVTDDDGASSTVVEEILVDLPASPTVHTGGASASTVHGAVGPANQATDWSVEYGPTEEYGAVTPAHSLPGDSDLHQVSATLPGLQTGRLYHYRVDADNATGSSSGADRVFVAGSAPSSDAYRDGLLGTAGLVDYWRLGELSGASSSDEVSATTGSFQGRYVLGQPGVLGPLRNTATSFDGASGELAVPGNALGANATLEGWFRWRAGTAVLRDSTSTGGTGWILAFNSAGNLFYRLGGQGFNTGLPIGTVRDGEWHHLAATKSGGAAALYVDGQAVHSSPTGAGSQLAAGPWHVMRNGTNQVFSAGEADELALYTRALSPSEVQAHYNLARDLADDPLPANPPADEPPAAGTGTDGGVLGPAPSGKTAGPPSGPVAISGARLIVRGAPGVRNSITARRRGRRWVVRDALARLRPGRGCRALGPRIVSCRAAGVRRIVMYGGAGNDRLTVIGRVAVTFHGGPGRDLTARRGSGRRAGALRRRR
ncbi:MAG TPA: BNR-4 repeat-containing protein [Thermoleophilaceae bacterium]|nr:BNR-4 repeat-containing protein [Thermoleophilaceae bacterium]